MVTPLKMFAPSNPQSRTCLCTDNTVPAVTIPAVFPPGDPRLNLFISKSCLAPGLRHIQHTSVNLEFRCVMTSSESNLTTCYLCEYCLVWWWHNAETCSYQKEMAVIGKHLKLFTGHKFIITKCIIILTVQCDASVGDKVTFTLSHS